MAGHDMIYLFHILFVGPLLVYAATRLDRSKNNVLVLILMILGFGVTGYHAFQYYNYKMKPLVV